MSEIVLKGIDGANPLGFLAAAGTLSTAAGSFCPDATLSWRRVWGSWRPVLRGCPDEEGSFCDKITKALKGANSEPFEYEKKLPFEAARLAEVLRRTKANARPEDRRTVDFLAAFGCEVCEDKGVFEDTFFRMVRSGDSAGQGLLFYALAIRQAVDATQIHRTLFRTWDYVDDGFSLRWDPLEDQRYALRWDDPSKNKNPYAPRNMRGANALALEALPLFPTAPVGKRLETTGFSRQGRRIFFSWPIWEASVGMATLRSVLSMREIHKKTPSREHLRAQGIVEVYRCRRIEPNQYYRNFATSEPA